MERTRKPQEKELYWAGSSKEDLLAFPDEVIDDAGYALHLAQNGGKHPNAKPLHGFGGASVMEIVLSDDGEAYRVVYAVQIGDVMVVLHAFQKKSKKGDKTPKKDLDTIERRLAEAKQAFGSRR